MASYIYRGDTHRSGGERQELLSLQTPGGHGRFVGTARLDGREAALGQMWHEPADDPEQYY